MNYSDGGKIIFSGYQSGYGNVIVINHGQGYRTIYAYLSKRLEMRRIQRNYCCESEKHGYFNRDSHLHYEVHFKENLVNPKPYLINHPFAQSEKERYVQ